MKILTICLLFVGLFQFAYGQSDIFPSTTNIRNSSPREANEQDFETRRSAMQRLTDPRFWRKAPVARAVRSMTKEEKEKRKRLLALNPADLLKYKSFLQQPKTGIFRLLPNFDCETKYIVRADEKCANFVSSGWAYSFRKKDYSNRHLHDIGFKGDFLVSESILAQGIFVSLGEVSPDDVSLTSEGLKYLTEFTPETDRQLVEKQSGDIAKGINHDGYFYSNKIKPEKGVTYALRAIAYKFKVKDGSRFRKETAGAEESEFLQLKYNERKDILVVFRIIEKSSDGGITILWKELQSKEPPVVIFQKDDKLGCCTD